MPTKPKSICRNSGCGRIAVSDGYCSIHKRTKEQSQHLALYKTPQWRKLRYQALRRDRGICVICEREGYQRMATDVDHIIEHSGDIELFYDLSNLQSLCKSCHSRKTLMKNMGKERG